MRVVTLCNWSLVKILWFCKYMSKQLFNENAIAETHSFNSPASNRLHLKFIIKSTLSCNCGKWLMVVENLQAKHLLITHIRLLSLFSSNVKSMLSTITKSLHSSWLHTEIILGNGNIIHKLLEHIHSAWANNYLNMVISGVSASVTLGGLTFPSLLSLSPPFLRASLPSPRLPTLSLPLLPHFSLRSRIP